jgi:hypothetical protein
VQATHEQFSIEASAIVTLVRTTASSSKFLTRINALSLFGCEERDARWGAMVRGTLPEDQKLHGQYTHGGLVRQQLGPEASTSSHGSSPKPGNV